MCISNIIAPQKYTTTEAAGGISTGHLITSIKVSLFHNSEAKVNPTKQRDEE